MLINVAFFRKLFTLFLSKIQKNVIIALCSEISIVEVRLASTWYENAALQLPCSSTESKSSLRKLLGVSEIKKLS